MVETELETEEVVVTEEDFELEELVVTTLDVVWPVELEELVETTLDVVDRLLEEETTLLLLNTWEVSLYISSLLPAPQYSSKS